jgi:hypothetical protein
VLPSTPNNPAATPGDARMSDFVEAVKKKSTAPGEPDAGNPPVNLTEHSLPQVWTEVLTQVGPMYAGNLRKAGLPAISGPNVLALAFPPSYNDAQCYCQDPAKVQRVETILRSLTGQGWSVRIETGAAVARNGNGVHHPHTGPVTNGEPAAKATGTPKDVILQHPLFQRVAERLGANLFAAQIENGFTLDEAPRPTDHEEK